MDSSENKPIFSFTFRFHKSDLTYVTHLACLVAGVLGHAIWVRP